MCRRKNCRIFLKNSIGGDESRNKKEGNGLGLYIVKYLAGAMGGSVRAENADGFEVCLKLPISGKGEAEDNGKQ